MSLTARFKSPEDASRFLSAYDATLALWAVPYESIEVSTSFGTTHINTAGSPDLPPLLLIHGAQISSPVWYPNIAALSQHFRIYALDVVDQMGRSVPTRKLATAQDCSDWLVEVLDALSLERVTLIGHSQGGWQATNLTITAPQRVERLVLLSPSGSLGRMRWQFLFHMLPVFVRPTRTTFYRAFQWLTATPLGTYHPLAEQFMIGAQSFNPKELSLGVVSVFSDESLRGIQAPVLLLIGENDGTGRPKREMERAQRLIPHLEAAIVPDAGHLLPLDQAEVVNERIIRFLQAKLTSP